MGWGWGGYYRRRSYGYGGGQSKKATANSLSTATIARILREKQEDEARQQQRMADYARQRAEREAAEAKERQLEEKHGGKEALAKWRLENAARLEAERVAKAKAQAEQAAEKKIVDAMGELRSELSQLPFQSQLDFSQITKSTQINLNKAAAKAKFHLTDRDLDALPKTEKRKEGAKRASSITWNGADLFAAVERKEGKQALRQYQLAAYPLVARQFIEEELANLEEKHPDHADKGRAEAVRRLVAAEKAGGEKVDASLMALKKAEEVLTAAIAKQHDLRSALSRCATAEEFDALKLPPILDEMVHDEEPSSAPAGGNNAEASSSTTPFTVGASGGPVAKKQKKVAGSAGKKPMAPPAAPAPPPVFVD